MDIKNQFYIKKKGEYYPLDDIINNSNLSNVLKVYFEINKLKQLYRQGWFRNGISQEECESVADHIFGVAILALLVSDKYFPELDQSKIMKLALIHEIGEIYGGDITPFDNISVEEKHEIEKTSVKAVVSKLSKGTEYLSLWTEYENSTSKEAILVKQLDKLEMALQSKAYKVQKYGNNLDEFLESAASKIDIKELKNLFEEINSI